jgi:hypothetical protein
MTQPVGLPKTPTHYHQDSLQKHTKEQPEFTHYDTVSLGFQWEATGLVPNAATTDAFFTTVVTHAHRVGRPAIPIQFNDQKLNRLLDNYEAMVQQSRSPNVLLATYGWIKLNGLTLVLFAAGISFHVLETRRKSALALAIEDNKLKFADNEYNLEMIQLITSEKNAKKTIASLTKIRNELCVHMAKLGVDDWYTPHHINRIQHEQVNRIDTYFSDEKSQLTAQKDHYYNTYSPATVTVRISDCTLDSLGDINQKLNRLAMYSTAVEKRKNQLNQHYAQLMGYEQFDTMNRHAETLGLSHSGVIPGVIQ